MAVALSFLALAAQASDALFSPADLAAVSGKALNADASYLALANNPATASLQIVQANPAALSERAASLTLAVEPGMDLRAHAVDSYFTRSGSLVWAGVIEDFSSVDQPISADGFTFDPVNTVMLVSNQDQIIGNVRYNGAWYQIRPLKSGGHALVKVNSAAMPPDHPAEYAGLRTIRMKTPRTQAGAKANTAIRVQVNYTPQVAALVANINGLIDLAVAETNQGYVNSGVAIDSVLASSAQTSYTESGNFSTDLARYRTTNDGFMDEIHGTRDSSTADVNVLLINNASACGLASSIGSTAATAFVAVYWDCATGYYSFAHEIGHLQSARHDPKNDPTTTPYAWGHGFQYTANKRNPWRTIMAYDCSGTGCPRLNYWSNPNKLYNGVAMGTATKNDNARVLNATAAAVASFR
ncbi:MAG TPA: M12 family metallo-peptidase [Thermoanaerobaculia bacterium]|jgi:hypothetical protein|nr:M12 family metallo-peptidase [Thermoanaerobaculia bacterium]